MAINNLGTAASFATRNNPTLTGTVDMSAATLVKGAGMDLITPTSVAGSGVTLSGGQVSFSAATSISVNGCFTSSYDSYLINVYMTTGASGTLSMRLRAAGTDASAADYNAQRMGATGTTFIGTRTSSATSWFGQTLVATLNTLSIQIYRPALAATTSAIVASGRGTDTSIDQDNFFLGHTLATSYDGFTIAPGSSSTGTLRIYGLRNS
jgi:hypothetical protein